MIANIECVIVEFFLFFRSKKLT